MNNCYLPILKEELKLPLYITAVGGVKYQKDVERPDGYPEYHWIHCVHGKGILKIENREFSISESMGFLLFPNIPHEYYPIKEPWETHWITFMGYAVPDILNVLEINKSEVFYINEIHLFDRLINDIFICAQSNNLTKGYKCSSLLYNILTELKNCSTYDNNPLKNSSYIKLMLVIEFIENNFNHNPTIIEMAESIDVSPQYLCRLFSNILRMRPFEYITKFRIQKAKELLLGDCNIQISEVSKKIGYNDLSYFCALFKKFEGITPMEYRKVYKL